MKVAPGKFVAMTTLAVVCAFASGCAKKSQEAPPVPPPAPPVVEAPRDTTPPPPVGDDEGRTTIGASDLRPAFFDLDSYSLRDDARTALDANARALREHSGARVTIEGHCDERGTAEYNLALGERRAVAAKTYLVSLGIAPDRVRTVSYGKEFPFDPGQDEGAWAKNRRAHFVITSR